MKSACLILAVLALLVLVGCQTDLTVGAVHPSWSGNQREVKVEILNRHGAGSGEFLTYVYGDEQPESQEHRPNITETIANLPGGAAHLIEADFAPLSHQDNKFLKNIHGISIFADPKDQVEESHEKNNRAWVDLREGVVINPNNLEVGGHAHVSQDQTLSQSFHVMQDGQLVGIELAIRRGFVADSDVLKMTIGDVTYKWVASDFPGPDQNNPESLHPYARGPGYADLTPFNIKVFKGIEYAITLETNASANFNVGMNGQDAYPLGHMKINDEDKRLLDLVFKVCIVP